MKNLLLTLILVTIFCGCGFDFDEPTYDTSTKEKKTVTTSKELPKFKGQWEGYCHQTDPDKPMDKITRLVLGQMCGESSMQFDLESKKINFEFAREFFEYYDSKEVETCPSGSDDCVCYEEDDKIKCSKFGVGKGECTLTVAADVKKTVLIEGESFLVSDYADHLVQLTNVQYQLVYLSEEVKKTKLPKDKDLPYGFYSNLQKAKSRCLTFAKSWRNKKKQVNFIYKINKENNELIFPGKSAGSLDFGLLNSPLMAFQKH